VQRSANVNALYSIIADAAPSKTTADWLELMGQRDIPCGRVNQLADLFAEPHLAAVELFQRYTHPSEGEMTAVRSPFTIAGAERKPDRPAPRLGDDTRLILQEAGFSVDEIQQFLVDRIIGGP
jgi:crotonobetainyl-CoA:carnitine CoA-transferase CaiB-like acyl-CoA transferase